ncbi:MAG: glycosyltransferase family 4 protein [Opitutaceae bacterium]|nr:glycosyltransferase family 4 protein [Cephaloticoccus sp.]MCP5531056.1 glycosyltransferase family 4 protein [Opitutaceae bacterium]
MAETAGGPDTASNPMTTPATGRLRGDVETSRPLRLGGRICGIEGWCLVTGESSPPPVRLRTGTATLSLTAREPREDLPSLFPGEAAAEHCGFTIAGALQPGLHVAHIEAEYPAGIWSPFKQFTIAVPPDEFHAGLDEPIKQGVLRDRVKVGGWALDLKAPVVGVSLHYGHRQIACQVDQPRADVAAAFPDVPHAGRCGFISEDFLVAGHGAVRIHARLSDGRSVIRETDVTYSIASDENHAVDLVLTGQRIGLTHEKAVTPPAPAPTDRTLNILFILHGSFAANSAIHVSALANELQAMGHDCCAAVTHDLETMARHCAPRFRGVLYSDISNRTLFKDGSGPAIIHAWTTRENVRQLTEQLRQSHPAAKIVIHLEDNERQILALQLKRTADELENLPSTVLDKLVPANLSHPQRSRDFLNAADGITVITDGLREFCPPEKPCHLIWPAADASHFYPRSRPDEFRAILDRRPDETVLFYHGNVHGANVAEVGELYRAVALLNRSGHPVTLIRTGLDTVDFPEALAPEARQHILFLGQIPHHHHLPALMSLADMFVQPGEPDAFNNYRFPSKLPEFFAIGRPVILPRTNLGAMLRHGKDAYVVDRADASTIAAAVVALRNDPKLCDELAQGALEFSRRHFSWRESAVKLANFYAELAR